MPEPTALPVFSRVVASFTVAPSHTLIRSRPTIPGYVRILSESAHAVGRMDERRSSLYRAMRAAGPFTHAASDPSAHLSWRDAGPGRDRPGDKPGIALIVTIN
jgi:hypothetical protein